MKINEAEPLCESCGEWSDPLDARGYCVGCAALTDYNARVIAARETARTITAAIERGRRAWGALTYAPGAPGC